VRAVGLPEVLLFDLDDTLVRFSAGQPDYWQRALALHLPADAPQAELTQRLRAITHANREYWADDGRAFWGRLNMWEARRIVARQALVGDPAELAERVADSMTEAKEEGVCLFAGAVATLEELARRGHRLGLLTNGSSAFQRRKLRRFELERHFEIILVEGELGFGKPDQRVFERALAFFGCRTHEACMIGDNLCADIAGAQKVGLRGVWHDGTRVGLPAGAAVVPDAIIQSVCELTDWRNQRVGASSA
jgi:putative hydrolase of the HAD superfamily